MKKQGITNRKLSGYCARLGHTQLIAVADCGLPIPADVPVIDVSVVQGVPRFEPVLAALLDELVIQRHVVAREADDHPAGEWIAQHSEQLGEQEVVSHEELKALLPRCEFVVRTGEATPFANVVLECGVPF